MTFILFFIERLQIIIIDFLVISTLGILIAVGRCYNLIVSRGFLLLITPATELRQDALLSLCFALWRGHLNEVIILIVR